MINTILKRFFHLELEKQILNNEELLTVKAEKLPFNVIRVIFPSCILGEDVLLKREYTFFDIHYESKKKYIFDISKVIYIDSIGIGFLSKQIKEIQLLESEIRIYNANEKRSEVIKMLGFEKYLDIEPIP